LTSSVNRNRPRRRLAGERRPPRAAAPTVVDQGSPDEAITESPTTPEPEAPAVDTPAAEAPTVEVKAAKGDTASGTRPSWLVAGVALSVAGAALVASLVIWRAEEDRQVLASNRGAAATAAKVLVEKMLGYDYRSFDRHTTEVSALLTGSFKNEFVQAATKAVKPLAVQNQAVVLAKASEVSVMSTPDQDTVRILAFVDQTTTSAKLERPQIDQNRVILTMSQTNGRWLVSKVEAF
jgi:Mce-associated membrane protein